MALRELLEVPVLAGASDAERARRLRRWHFFQIVFVLTYVGVVLDEFTTALGYLKSGTSYEQNPIGGLLIGNLSWFGLWVLVTLACVVCYFSFRVVYFRLPLAWSLGLNALVVVITIFRWIVVGGAVLYLVG